jgi:DNA-binding NtrC family response regulator
MHYRWPGNIRELRNTIEKMVVLTRGDRLGVRDIPSNIRQAVREQHHILGVSPKPNHVSAHASAGTSSLADTEKNMILQAIEQVGGNRTKAAEVLGISRRTLHRKLKQYKEGSHVNEEKLEGQDATRE